MHFSTHFIFATNLRNNYGVLLFIIIMIMMMIIIFYYAW